MPDDLSAEPSDHPLIAEQLNRLAERLPADIVDELADGLRATYDAHRARGADLELAAADAVAEFGDAGFLIRQFQRQAPGRRVSLRLLATGPAVGACWAIALITDQAWTWPAPAAIRIACAASLAALVATLVTVALARRSYRQLNHLAAAAGAGLMVLDGTALLALALLGPSLDGLLLPAVLASTVRIALTSRAMPALLR
jgi:hypothetical protein